jgi:outer membrane protein TolC
VRRAFTIAGLCLATAACAGFGRPPAPHPHDATSRLAPTGASPWREDLGDPTLHALLAQADLANLDIKLALARLERARAEEGVTGGHRLPQATIGLEAAVGAARDGEARSRGVPSLESTYEIDLFGRLTAAAQAAAADGRASAIDVEAARLLIGAETARAWSALVQARDLAQAEAARSDAAAGALALVRLRAEAGRATSEEVETRRQAVEEAQVRRRTADSEIEGQRIRLTALLGRTELIATPVPGLGLAPPAAPPALSSDLVAARPEVRAAYERLSAADSRRAEAVAASRPKFILSLAAGAVDPSVANLLDVKSVLWALGAGLTHDLLDGGAAKARIRGAQAEVDAADLAYRKAVVDGWSEMRVALLDAATAREAALAAQAGLDRAQRALAALERRHGAGLADGVDLAAGRDELARAAQAAAEARGRAQLARVRLALAFGGGV